jgi:nicotinate phosphoribosyltransferase
MTDTVRAMESFDRHMPQEVPRVALVDTFKDEAEEALNVARSLREKLRGVRLDTPAERGGVTPQLVREVRARLDLAGFRHVEIMVSGGFTPERIQRFVEDQAPINTFGVGAFIGTAPSIPFTADIHEVDGRPIAKRGRMPGITANPRLDRVM